MLLRSLLEGLDFCIDLRESTWRLSVAEKKKNKTDSKPEANLPQDL